MLYRYTYIDENGNEQRGELDALNEDVAISSLQSKGITLTSIQSTESKSIFERDIAFFERVSNRDIVIMSRQIATLFKAKVSALRVFRLLADEAENPLLKRVLSEMSDDISAGSSISEAMEKHTKVFNDFYVSMVASGEESGTLDKTFNYLADYLDRNYEITSKAKNALIYPSFVIFTFIAVMTLMLTTVIPKVTEILVDSGQDIPVYTRFTIGLSQFVVNYGLFLLAAIVIGAGFLWRWVKTPSGERAFSHFKLSVPVVGDLYRKLYLARIADNLNTMLLSGISMVRALEATMPVVDNQLYKDIIEEAIDEVKSGTPLSEALAADNNEIPRIMTQMIRIGEETGELGNILKTLSDFYQREVLNTVDSLVSLIEPAMIVLLGIGVGFLLASVLVPIYNLSSAF